MKTNDQEHTILGIKQQANLGKKPRICFKKCKKSFKLKYPAQSKLFCLNKKWRKLSKTAHSIEIGAVFLHFLEFLNRWNSHFKRKPKAHLWKHTISGIKQQARLGKNLEYFFQIGKKMLQT